MRNQKQNPNKSMWGIPTSTTAQSPAQQLHQRQNRRLRRHTASARKLCVQPQNRTKCHAGHTKREGRRANATSPKVPHRRKGMHVMHLKCHANHTESKQCTRCVLMLRRCGDDVRDMRKMLLLMMCVITGGEWQEDVGNKGMTTPLVCIYNQFSHC